MHSRLDVEGHDRGSVEFEDLLCEVLGREVVLLKLAHVLA